MHLAYVPLQNLTLSLRGEVFFSSSFSFCNAQLTVQVTVLWWTSIFLGFGQNGCKHFWDFYLH